MWLIQESRMDWILLGNTLVTLHTVYTNVKNWFVQGAVRSLRTGQLLVITWCTSDARRGVDSHCGGRPQYVIYCMIIHSLTGSASWRTAGCCTANSSGLGLVRVGFTPAWREERGEASSLLPPSSRGRTQRSSSASRTGFRSAIMALS